MIIRESHIYPLKIDTHLFSLYLSLHKDTIVTTMKLLVPIVNTCELPHTFHFLYKSLPSILKSQCYNPDNLPFHKEVQQTEIGHLFEHILLEYLCLIKLELGYQKASFRGRTDWNWKKDPKGTFHIFITINSKDLLFLPQALDKSILLLKSLMTPQKPQFYVHPHPSPLPSRAREIRSL